ncbi:hypothetical protein XELAEV_18032195mg [Xenopus laevis]|uniref:Uncharacterized protein n=1 Tax=Xenopus laevis TaxID=8355 RepID=A0A974CQ86_XENLA|nr:hypothetical protein XELAEV_18032195mg [Xenopus laevis]
MRTSTNRQHRPAGQDTRGRHSDTETERDTTERSKGDRECEARGCVYLQPLSHGSSASLPPRGNPQTRVGEKLATEGEKGE